MGYSVFPAPAAGSKTRYVTTLTSGTSWTVPTGVTYVNATLVGGSGGGGAGANFPGKDGHGGKLITTKVDTTPGASITYAIGAGGTAGAIGSSGGAGGSTTFTGATTGTGGNGGTRGSNSVTGTEGTANAGGGLTCGGQGGGGQDVGGGAGAAGCIIIEYWAQEITMEKTFAVIEDNKVVNIIVGLEDEVVAANPGKYIEYTNGWDYNNGIDGGDFFPVPVEESTND